MSPFRCNGTTRSGDRCEHHVATEGGNCGQCVPPDRSTASRAAIGSLSAQAANLDQVPSLDLSNWAPAEVDTEIARLLAERAKLAVRAEGLERTNRNYAKHAGTYYQSYISKNNEELERLKAEDSALAAELAPYEAEFAARPWTRAFVVPDGHVHSSMQCSTCYPTTRFAWLPDYSGSDEATIVEDAGERACTVCYPSAPVDVLSRPTKIFSDEEKADMEAKAARALELERKRADKAAKAIVAADGSPLYVYRYGSRDRVNTEVTARREAAGALLDIERARYALAQAEQAPGGTAPEDRQRFERRIIEEQANLDRITEAIAAKHARPAPEVLAELQTAGERKVRQWEKDGRW